jgi:hypothetical protein
LFIVLVFCVVFFAQKTKTLNNTEPPKNTTQKTKTMSNTKPPKTQHIKLKR